MTRSWVYDQTRGLIENKNVLIFKHDVERDILTFMLFNHCNLSINDNLFAAGQLIARAQHFAINGQLPLFYPPLQA